MSEDDQRGDQRGRGGHRALCSENVGGHRKREGGQDGGESHHATEGQHDREHAERRERGPRRQDGEGARARRHPFAASEMQQRREGMTGDRQNCRARRDRGSHRRSENHARQPDRGGPLGGVEQQAGGTRPVAQDARQIGRPHVAAPDRSEIDATPFRDQLGKRQAAENERQAQTEHLHDGHRSISGRCPAPASRPSGNRWSGV